MTTMKLDLNKSAKAVQLRLEKAGVPKNVQAQLTIIMDVSASFEHEHEEGTTSTLIERIVPIAMNLDPDGQIDVISFSDGEGNVQFVGTVSPDNCSGYVNREIVSRVRGWNGGTTYSYALEEALKRFGYIDCDHDHGSSVFSRFWKKATGQTAVPHRHEKQKSIIWFVTDGENDPDGRFGDKRRTMDVLKASQDRGDDIYFLFIGACEHAEFEFVRKIADMFSNTGIVMATDPEEFVGLPDDQLLDKLLQPELVNWLKQ